MPTNLRYEVKMVMDDFYLGELRSWVFSHSNAFRIAYPSRQVNNLYFDTLDHEFMMDHIDGVPDRAKIRYRWYGQKWQLNGGQLEIKKKNGRLGNKEIYPFARELDLSQVSWREIRSALQIGMQEFSPQIADLIDLLQPTLINHYQREYYISMDGLLRVTLDYHLQAYEQGFGFKPNLRFPQPSARTLILELKAAKDDYQRIADALSEFPQRCSQNSKYLTGREYAIG